MIICPNNSSITDTPKFYDKAGNLFLLPEGTKIEWVAGDAGMASIVIASNTLSAQIVPLRTAVGDYLYSYTAYLDTGPVTVNETVTFENPFPVAGKSFQTLGTQTLGG